MRALIFCLCLATPLAADPAVVEEVGARASGDTWSFSVTLSHPDTGWDHYADGWRVELEDGTVLGTRELVHPHVNEQPFTRSLSGVVVPDGAGTVFVRARDNLDNWGTERLSFELER